ncbi:MAG: GGDEF domain-containing protein [Acidiphilium sp.]|nr:GGDEF domain-containing protein [Acidiphilium sp.]MDD4936167.1 GGDEF domain-containing protein [Acidiphilium sp.]
MPLRNKLLPDAAPNITLPVKRQRGRRWQAVYSRIARALQSDSERRQPLEVREELMHVLFGRPANVLLVGTAGISCGLFAYARQGEMTALGLGVVGFALVAIRYQIILMFRRRFLKARCLDLDRWFALFGITAIASSLAWGVLTFYCLAMSSDPVLYTAVLVSNVATAGGIAARNAAAPGIAKLQLLAGLVPIMAGAPLTDNAAYSFLILLVPALIYGLFVLIAEINQQLVQSYRSQLKLSALSNIDYLTQIANRRYFGEWSSDALERCKALRQPLAILMIDVDYFKMFNDHYGHQAGDACLQQVAAILQENLRHGGDVVSRYGGEEFAVSLQNASAGEARLVAQRLCDAVASAALPHGYREDGGAVVTVSVGAVATDQLYVGLEALVRSADKALYEAKRDGRNRVAVARAFESLAPMAVA